MSAVLERSRTTQEPITGSNEGVPNSIIKQITGGARAEVNREGTRRGLTDRQTTMRAGHLCPDQGVVASQGFIQALQ